MDRTKTVITAFMILTLFFMILLPEQSFCEEVVVGASASISPYIIAENDSGIEREILDKVLSSRGHKARVEYLPFARAYYEFNHGRLDCVINVKPGSVSHGYYTDPVIDFHNVAISLAEKNLKCSEISDLKGKSLAGFQNASILLGDEFEQVTRSNRLYSEHADQTIQLNLLFKKRADFIVLEEKIFRRQRNSLKQLSVFLSKDELDAKVVFHRIFEPNTYRFVFRSEKIRDDFNSGLKEIKKNGIYDEIIKKYESVTAN